MSEYVNNENVRLKYVQTDEKVSRQIEKQMRRVARRDAKKQARRAA